MKSTTETYRDEAKRVLRKWVRQGYTLIGHGDGPGWYPCRNEDVPRGACGTYLPLGGQDALEAITAGLAAGWTYRTL